MKSRRMLAAIAGLALALGILTPSTALAVNPGWVSPIINTTPGSGTFSFHANTVGWYPGTVSVSYTMYDGPSSAGPWSYYYSDARTCSGQTSCSTPTQLADCSNGWYMMVAHASGPGGGAENNGASVVKYVWGPVIAAPIRTTSTSFGLVVPASISSECKYKTNPI